MMALGEWKLTFDKRNWQETFDIKYKIIYLEKTYILVARFLTYVKRP